MLQKIKSREIMEKIRQTKIMSVLIFVCYVLAILMSEVAGEQDNKHLNRNNFPSHFVFGVSTSAYQVEGAASEDGRTPSVYDTFAHSHLPKNDTRKPDVACDQYHKYKEDVQLMADSGLDAHRFSISWSRLIPNGRGAVNPKGLRYYNNFINELIIHGIEPHVTLLHSDVPQILEDEYGSFLDPRIVDDFTAYVDVCFREFGDRVRYWTTFNEANIYVFGGYDVGITPPNRCSSPFGLACTKGNSTIEPYLATHHILLAHASATKLYREKYKADQHGFVGFNLLSYHFSPLTNTTEDINSARRAYDFMIGWFMHPFTYGDYPPIVKENAGSKIPVFTKDQSKLLKGSIDFIGINYYSVMVTKDNSNRLSTTPRDFYGDMAVQWVFLNASSPPQLEEGMFPNEPWGLERVLDYYKDIYENPVAFIHENGQASGYNTAVNDPYRIEYLHDHISSLLRAIRNGSNTKGYFVWSVLDVYELLFNFDFTFGLYYVDYNDPNLSRHPKLSQKWYSAFLKGENVTVDVRVKNNILGLDRFPTSVGNDEVLRRHPKFLQHMSS